MLTYPFNHECQWVGPMRIWSDGNTAGGGGEMIELRWVVRKVKNLRPEANVYNGHPMEKVLQYRQWLIRLDAGGAITPTPLPIEWTEWEDVPTVSEE